jgi:hypothetical protein
MKRLDQLTIPVHQQIQVRRLVVDLEIDSPILKPLRRRVRLPQHVPFVPGFTPESRP